MANFASVSFARAPKARPANKQRHLSERDSYLTRGAFHSINRVNRLHRTSPRCVPETHHIDRSMPQERSIGP
ncbi:hypothetical protein RF55_25071, partial [Lasius niger]